jgi:hypothetical protein
MWSQVCHRACESMKNVVTSVPPRAAAAAVSRLGLAQAPPRAASAAATLSSTVRGKPAFGAPAAAAGPRPPVPPGRTGFGGAWLALAAPAAIAWEWAEQSGMGWGE